MVHTEFSIQALDGIKLFAQEWKSEGEIKAAIVLVHGLGEHSNRYKVAHGSSNMLRNFHQSPCWFYRAAPTGLLILPRLNNLPKMYLGIKRLLCGTVVITNFTMS